MASRFITGTEIEKLVKEAEEIKESGKIFSDTIDSENNQYVDLVQEGGGVLGIALVGYTYILEKAGIRFYSLAGTSAGSINTILMAGLAKPGEISSEKIVEILGEKNFFDFVDGPPDIKKFLQRIIEDKGRFWWYLVWNVCEIYYLMKKKLGLNPGKDFENWLNGILKNEGIENFHHLKEKRKQIPKLKHRHDPEFKYETPDIAIVTSEITTHTKVEFPGMAELYWSNVSNVKPAEFVRASMSIPFFFYPYEVKDIPRKGEKEVKAWEDLASYSGTIPESVKFVDGGMLSNFPIDTFHVKDKIPSRPTFGARLSTYRESFSKTDKISGYCGAMISTMRQIHDYDFILKNPDYRELICRIDADKEFNWLNFGMNDKTQDELFLLGAKKGLEFLKTFDWQAYKTIRKNCIIPNKQEL